MEQHQADRKDEQLWEIAKRRASFKSHLFVYIIVNTFLWILWYLQGADYGHRGMPWPVWSSIGWGIGLVSHYLSAYVSTGQNAVEREYEKLKKEQSR